MMLFSVYAYLLQLRPALPRGGSNLTRRLHVDARFLHQSEILEGNSFRWLGCVCHGLQDQRCDEAKDELHFQAIASDQQRPAGGQTEFLEYGAMWSGNIIDNPGEIKGVRCG